MLARHHDITASISFPRHNRHLRHGGLRVGVKQLRPVPDDAVILLRYAGQETGYVDECHQRYIEAIAKPNESRRFDGSVDIETSCQVRRLISDNSHRTSAQAREANQN